MNPQLLQNENPDHYARFLKILWEKTRDIFEKSETGDLDYRLANFIKIVDEFVVSMQNSPPTHRFLYVDREEWAMLLDELYKMQNQIVELKKSKK